MSDHPSNTTTDTDTTATPDSVPDAAPGVLAALDRATMAIFVLDSTFTVRWINETAARYFGIDRESVIGRDKRALIEEQIKPIFDRPERFADTVTATYDDNSYIEEFDCHVLAGAERDDRWLRHTSQPITEGPFAGGRVEHYTDITDTKTRERELVRERDRLDEFASVVSHDLRNPLNVAQGQLDLVRTGRTDSLDTIGDALTRMERIIDDVLWLARAGRDIGATDQHILRDAIDAAWTFVTDDETNTALSVSPELADYQIDADGDRLSQLLENLFANAISHGGDDVTVRVEPTATGFAIADDGPGIPPERREQIFDSGYTSTDTGTGLGLGIVARIVAAHGWEIDVTESTSGGARFEINGINP